MPTVYVSSPACSGVTRHRQPWQCRGAQGPKTAWAVSVSLYFSRLNSNPSLVVVYLQASLIILVEACRLIANGLRTTSGNIITIKSLGGIGTYSLHWLIGGYRPIFSPNLYTSDTIQTVREKVISISRPIHSSYLRRRKIQACVHDHMRPLMPVGRSSASLPTAVYGSMTSRTRTTRTLLVITAITNSYSTWCGAA